MTLFEFIVLGLASYRITHLLVFDKIFEPVREWFVARSISFDRSGVAIEYRLQGGPIRHFIGGMLNCPWCASIWASAAVVVAYLFVWWVIYVLEALAIAAMVGLIETVWMKYVGMPEMREKE
jgi:hypothetical protein